MPIKNGKNRSKIKMMCLDDHVAKDSYVRVLETFVDCLDLQTLGFKKHVESVRVIIASHS